MFAILNDISISPDGVTVADNWSILNEVIDISAELSKKFRIELLTVPVDFRHRSIAGSLSINDYMAMTADDFDIDKLILLSDFFYNRTTSEDTEVQVAIEKYHSGKPIDVYLDGVSSTLITGGYVLKLPIVSFQTKAIHSTTPLQCQFISYNGAGELVEKNIELPNIFSNASIEIHEVFLSDIKHQIVYANKNWSPDTQPCWNTALVAEINTVYNYPICLEGLSSEERIAINKQVSDKILLRNGWLKDSSATNKNHHRPEIWRIYYSNLSNDTFYISVDLSEGHFEIQNRKGKWVRTVFFDGRETGRNYNNTYHDINI